ncbi:MAG: XdhC/CoxI family protein [Candidatus Eremiobacteraeota bacterium]|nr:XdhC/CoxI family protein [Candidatus Eremiobacteraeota bacterium]
MDIYRKIAALIDEQKEMVIVTVVETLGSTPARKAFKMIVLADGTTAGTVGGGALEYEAVKKAKECLNAGRNALQELNLEKIGMACGGAVKIFHEYIAPLKSLYIFGGGHICQAVAPMAAALGFSITVIDNREEIARQALHPAAKKVILGEYTEVIGALPIHHPAYCLIVSHKHGHDAEILKALLMRDDSFAYIGMIGSRKKVKVTFENLLREGIDRQKLEHVYSPVGLAIGADTPAEIAVSILAEMIALGQGAEAPHMRCAPEAAKL